MYQVTATRRRPQTFDALLGQEFVSATLKKSIESNKIAHAYLFSGPRGCGKTSTARILAKSLNCVNGPTASPCGVCDSCIQITNGSSFDVIEIDGASNTGVDDVRKLKDEILFPPHSARYKVYIIDEVHMLSTNAFNALLKTIEEPPPYVIFIFATTELHKVPATIKSRCQQFNFKLVDIEVLKDALAQAADEIGIQADDEALYWIAREGTGSVRDSYTLFDQVAAFSVDHISLEKIQDKLGLTGIEIINDIVLACMNKNANAALSILHECLNNGVSVEQFCIDCAKYFRTLLLVKHGITKESILGQSASRFSLEVIQTWNSVQVERALAIMLQLFKDIHLSVNPTYELELAISRLSLLSDYVPPNELKIAYEKLKELFSSKPLENNNNDIKMQSGQSIHAMSKKMSQEHNETINRTDTPQTYSPKTETSYDTVDDIPPPEVYEGQFESFSEANNFSSQLHTQSPKTEYSAEIIRTPTIDEIKHTIIEEFTKGEPVLATSLTETFDWEKDNNTIIIKAKKRFHQDTIKAQIHKIKEKIARILHSPSILIEVQLVDLPEKITSDDKTPVEIKNLMRKFQAQLVDVIDISEPTSEQEETELA